VKAEGATAHARLAGGTAAIPMRLRSGKTPGSETRIMRFARGYPWRTTVASMFPNAVPPEARVKSTRRK